jgi:hypothetical protein
VFQSQFYPLKINKTLNFFTYSWAELNVVYVLKKKQAKKSIFDPKILEPSILIRPEILILPPTFQMPASNVVGFCATCGNIKGEAGGSAD